MANILDSQRKRLKLEPRHPPYWVKIKRGKSLGFCKDGDVRSWRARMYNEHDKYIFKALGDESDLTYEQAFDLADKWFKSSYSQKRSRYTVKNAVDDYVTELENSGRQSAAKDSSCRLYKHLIPVLGKKELSSLTTTQINQFRTGLVKKSSDKEVVRKSQDTANRIMNMVKAAFNLAYRTDFVASDAAWKKVSSYKGVSAARILFLSDTEVSTLINEAEGQLQALIKAAILTGARYGELAEATVRDFSESNKTIYLAGKTGGRTTFLSSSGVKFFSSLVENKSAKDLIFIKDDGTRWGKNHHSRIFKSVVTRTELPKETVFYSLRHYHISKALLAQISIQVIAENTGTSIRMIEKHYGKFLNSDRQQMFDSVDVPIN